MDTELYNKGWAGSETLSYLVYLLPNELRSYLVLVHTNADCQ